MAELDLIPPGYLRRRRWRRWTLRSLAGYVALLLSLLGLRVFLADAAEEYQRETASLKIEHERAEEEHLRITQLRSEQADLNQRLVVLDGLRGGVAAKEMFVVVDRALDENVWFNRWSFRRAGQIVEEKPDTVETGYFIVLPQTSKDEPRRAWRLETHMEILAESQDHSDLAGFVSRLSEQEEIEATRILSTKSQGDASAGRVGFELAVLVRSGR